MRFELRAEGDRNLVETDLDCVLEKHSGGCSDRATKGEATS